MSTWTTEKPTVPGWYWWRAGFGRKPTMLNISQSHIDRNDVFTMNTEPVGFIVLFLHELPGHWAGPIEPPNEVQP